MCCRWTTAWTLPGRPRFFRVCVIAYVPEAFGSVGILDEGFEGISALPGVVKAESVGLDIDNAC